MHPVTGKASFSPFGVVAHRYFFYKEFDMSISVWYNKPLQDENSETVGDWYNSELKKIKSKYSHLRETLIAEEAEEISDLNNELLAKSMTCVHNWIRKSGLFYFCGDAHDGYECKKCLSIRRLNERLHRVGH